MVKAVCLLKIRLGHHASAARKMGLARSAAGLILFVDVVLRRAGVAVTVTAGSGVLN